MMVAVMPHPCVLRRAILSRPLSSASFRDAEEHAYNRGMQYAVGIDAIEIARVRRVLLRHPERFLRRVYTAEEVAFCRGRVAELAARFAAKEAVMKALGTGARGLAWREIEILPNSRGKPLVYLHGLAQKRAERIGLRGVDVSLTHSRELAIASVVGAAELEPVDRESNRERLVAWLRERGRL
jgi:holo-[acyl-carrier protein] synthase